MEFPIRTALLVFTLALWAGMGPFWPLAEAQQIHEIPRLSGDLPEGSLAWATVDQLHPAQPQTGFREVQSTTQDFLQLLRHSAGDFPTGLFETLLKKGYIIPVHLTRTPEWDSRSGRQDVLGFATDRTHEAAALALAYASFFGQEGLSEPRYDAEGRVLNFILVRVVQNHCDLRPSQFAERMEQGQNCYLTEFYRQSDLSSGFRRLKFWDLPEKVHQTTDNPYRGLIGALQRRGEIKKTGVHFAEFDLAAELARLGVVHWDEISSRAGPKRYQRALQRAADYFRMKNCLEALLSIEKNDENQGENHEP